MTACGGKTGRRIHTAATVLLEENVNIKYVSRQLRHSSVSTRQNIYQHVTERMSGVSAKIMDGIISGVEAGVESTEKQKILLSIETKIKIRMITISVIMRIFGAEDRARTGTKHYLRGILSPLRLPIPPPRHGNI